MIERVRLSGEARQSMRKQLEAAYPEEACGGLLAEPSDGAILDVVAAVAAANEHSDERRRRYLIGPDDILALEREAEARGLQVAGYYHSHPDAEARPSAYDREHAWPWYVYVIVSVREGRAVETRAWQLAEDRHAFLGVEIEGLKNRTLETE